MRGRPCTQRGDRKISLLDRRESASLVLLLRWVRNRPLIRPGFAGPPSPRGEGFGGGKPPVGYPIPFRPTDSPGRAHPAGPGGSPQENPKGPTYLSAPPTRPVGHASQSSAGRSRRKRIQSCFDRLRRPKHTSHPESAGFAGAVRGAIPQFWEGPPTKQAT